MRITTTIRNFFRPRKRRLIVNRIAAYTAK